MQARLWQPMTLLCLLRWHPILIDHHMDGSKASLIYWYIVTRCRFDHSISFMAFAMPFWCSHNFCHRKEYRLSFYCWEGLCTSHAAFNLFKLKNHKHSGMGFLLQPMINPSPLILDFPVWLMHSMHLLLASVGFY